MTLPSNPQGWLNPCTSLALTGTHVFYPPCALRFRSISIPRTHRIKCITSRLTPQRISDSHRAPSPSPRACGASHRIACTPLPPPHPFRISIVWVRVPSDPSEPTILHTRARARGRGMSSLGSLYQAPIDSLHYCCASCSKVLISGLS